MELHVRSEELDRNVGDDGSGGELPVRVMEIGGGAEPP